MRIILVFAALLFAPVLFAAEMRTHRDLAYAESNGPLQKLDVYAPAGGKDRSIVVWIHGGGWRQGDKTGVQQKPQAFVDKGLVFVSINYRFVPQVTVKEMTGDVAKAIRWVHDHAQEYGGKKDSIFVMGHSAGAHLAALVCTDERYLKQEGLPLSIVKGCVPVDTSAYDIPQRAASVAGSVKARLAKKVQSPFGDDPAVQKDLSPIAHVAKGKSIPAFLLLHVASRPDSKAQSQDFAKALQAAGVSATVVAAEDKTHGTINTELGHPDDKPTKELFNFVNRQLNPQATTGK